MHRASVLVIAVISASAAGLGIIAVIFPNLIPSAFLAVSMMVYVVLAGGIAVSAYAAAPRTGPEMMKRADAERVVSEYRDIIVLLEEKNDYLIAKWDSLEQNRKMHARDLTLARAIQRNILPREFPASERIRCAAHYQPIEGVGGDLYDVIALDRDIFLVIVADVAGHGVSSALIAAMLKAAIASYAVRYPSPGILLARINKNLVQQIPTAHFVTAVAAQFNCETDTLIYANAGHPQPLFRRGRTVSELPARGPILGTFPAVSYTEECMTLCPGDKFVFYTDGVTDLSGHADKREMFGGARLSESLAHHGALDIAGVVDGIKSDLASYTHRPDDDLTLLGVEISRKPPVRVNG
ncbi:MAG: PP2C family protein-serine/threonine phosphatase [Spirochaetota bacterium]